MATLTLDSLSLQTFSGSYLPAPTDSPEFVSLGLPNRCPQCQGVLRHAMQLACGHHVCQNPCLDQLFGESEVILCEFEDCGYEISKAQVFPDTFKRREILKERVYCTYRPEGCHTVVMWKDLQNHTKDCEFMTIPCIRSAEGCLEKLSKTSYDLHITQECDYLPVVCENCDQTSLKGRLQSHRENDCPMTLMECPFRCSSETFLRVQLENHKDMCPNKPASCAFGIIGCEFGGSVSDVEFHERNDVSKHLVLISQYSANMERQNLQVMKEMKVLKEETDCLERQRNELASKVEIVKKESAASKKAVKDMKTMIASHGERVIKLERTIGDMANRTSVDQVTKELVTVKETNQTLLNKVNLLETLGPVAGHTGAYNSGQVASKMKHLDSQSSLHNIRLAEFDMRFQILETANYEGALMWKIRDYRRRRQEAIDGRTLSLFSQPFYTGRHGYKMCGRVYLNGDGMGKETHLSFFFVLMKGDYDSLLPWPFKQRVSLILKDQDTRTQDLCDTFTPNTSSNSFKKPVSEMNVASGVPKFIPHIRLETKTYMQEDTVYLMMKVDQGDLPNHPNP